MRTEVPSALAGERVDRVIAMLTGLSRSSVTDLVGSGAVTVSGKKVSSPSLKLREGDTIEADLPVVSPKQLEPDPSQAVVVAFADHDVIVIDKAAGVVVHPGAGNPTGTLVQGLLARFPDLAAIDAGEPHRPGVVHRLDKGTSGLLVVARSTPAFHALTDQIKRHAVERRYLVLVAGCVEDAAGVIDAPVGRSPRTPVAMAVSATGRPARTRYSVRARYSSSFPATLLECHLETGRTHQIRVHLAAIGHPVVGDQRYGKSKGSSSLAMGRPFLHANYLAFHHPVSGARMEFSSELPGDLGEVLTKLGRAAPAG